MQQKVFVVSHTHWDREWYLTKTEFQMMNVDMMDQLLSILEENSDFASFMLDGQLVALEDYLQVHPEKRDKIAGLVKEKRLFIGPWYVLPDEYLASGEAHIRNFMRGMALAEGFGGGMRLGYLPDSFGHPSQMPQIIAGLGMGELIFWRGPGPEVEHAEFDWVGKDGTEILALNMVYGYSNAANLKADKAVRHKRLDHEIDKLLRLSHMELALLMNGSDHIAPDGRVPGWLKEYQEAHPELEMAHTTLAAYVAEAKQRREKLALQKVRGELRSGYRAYLLGDTLSTRMPIKQAQRQVEVLLENQLEPLFALLKAAKLQGYPMGKLNALWKLALQNLPHDSICGCSLDTVHQEMMGRYLQMNQMGGHLLGKAREALAADRDFTQQADGELTVVSGALHGGGQRVTARLERVLHPIRYVDYEQDQKLLEFEGDETFETPTGVELTGADGTVIHGTIESVTLEDTMECNLMTQPTMNRVMAVNCSFTADLPGLSISRFAYRFTYGKKQAENVLENEYLAVEAGEDGTLSVLCKETGRRYTGLARLLDMADVGDEYTFDPIAGDTGVTMPPETLRIIRQEGCLRIEGTLTLPARCAQSRRARSPETVACPVILEARLFQGMPYVEATLTVYNRAEDHRLMALFPLGEKADTCLSDSLFAIEQREIVRGGQENAYEGWMEKPNNSFFQKNFADLSQGTVGLSVLVKGLPQFEVQAEDTGDTLRLTLLRCVGWISRKDLTSRNGNGGWSVETPEAQEKGLRSFSFAIMPHGKRQPHQLYQEAMRYVAPPVALQTSRQGAGAPTVTQPYCLVDDKRIAFSALKAPQTGEGLVLRLCNMSGGEVEATISFPWHKRISFTGLSLDERLLENLPAQGNCAELRFKPWQIHTILVKEA